MLYNASVKDYNTFKNIFGSRSNGGRIVNKILLSFWQYRRKIDGDWRATQIKSLDDLFELVMNQLCAFSFNHEGSILSLGNVSYNFKYIYTFKFLEFPVDFNYPKNIKIKENHSDKILSIGAGKIFRRILKESKARLDEKTITYCSERFQNIWDSYFNNNYKNIKLHVDKNFKLIYTSEEQRGNFGSCMNNHDQWYFYLNSVNASAAYLTGGDDCKVLARCIIFHDVKDTVTNKTYNYAERQYSEKSFYKDLLIKMLIEKNIIDIYKSVGAGCRDRLNIRKNNGDSFDCDLRISCSLKPGDKTSFMDTFAFYDSNEQIAYAKISNESDKKYYRLDTTQSYYTPNN